MANLLPIPNFTDVVLQRLDNMRRNAILTDVTISCGGKKFFAHKCYLSSASQYLYTMFNSSFKESNESVIDFPSIEPNSLEIIFNILYSGNFTPVEFHELPDLLPALHLLNLEDLYSYYRNELIKSLRDDHFLVQWQVGETLKDDVILFAVYDLLKDLYPIIDFRSIHDALIQKFLQFLSLKEISHDVVLKVIIEIDKQKGNDQLDELINLVDFRKLSNSRLANISKESIFKNSPALQAKCYSISLQRLEFITEFSKIVQGLSSLILCGQNSDKQWVLQKCHLGEWDILYLEDNIMSQVYVIAVEKNIYKFVVIREKKKKSEIIEIEYDSRKHKKCSEREIKEDFKFDDTILKRIRQSGITDTIPYKVKENGGANIEEGVEFETYWKIHFLLADHDIYSIVQAQTVGGAMRLYITKSRHASLFELGDLQYSVDWTNNTSNWYAYFYPPKHIVVRCFPGQSLYYNIQRRKMLFREDQNSLEAVVSLMVYGWNVCCLTGDGCVYVQDMRRSIKEWKLLVRCPFPLHSYSHILIKTSMQGQTRNFCTTTATPFFRTMKEECIKCMRNFFKLVIS